MNEFEANIVIDILELLNGEDIQTCKRILAHADKVLNQYFNEDDDFDHDYFLHKIMLRGIAGDSLES